MKVILAENSGFCFGVKRAINMALESVNKKKGEVCTYGPIIHNHQVVEDFRRRGISVIDDTRDLRKGSTCIIRTHGLSPDIIAKFRKKSVKIVDATCVFVKKAQKLAAKLYKDGYQVVIIGESEHPEVKGICGYTGNRSIVIRDIEDARKLSFYKKIGVLVQTTQSIENFTNIIPYLIQKSGELKIFNTICNATRSTKDSALKLAEKVDIMIIVGGHNSANTKHLAEVCRSTGVETYHIEDTEELKKEWFLNKKSAGVTAGASTPDWVINDVVSILKKI
jgi:4-hydroxy-3-methylbut-2-enyl diphosphate reductase